MRVGVQPSPMTAYARKQRPANKSVIHQPNGGTSFSSNYYTSGPSTSMKSRRDYSAGRSQSHDDPMLRYRTLFASLQACDLNLDLLSLFELCR